MNPQKLIALQKLLAVITSQDFCDWFAHDLESYISGDEDAKTKDQILADLENFTKLQ